jgi:hypothetical protein
MSGPGEYLPDPTQDITKPEDLPQPKVVWRSRNTSIPPVHVVTIVVGRTTSAPGFCPTWEIWLPAGPVTSISFTHTITAPSAVNVFHELWVAGRARGRGRLLYVSHTPFSHCAGAGHSRASD